MVETRSSSSTKRSLSSSSTSSSQKPKRSKDDASTETSKEDCRNPKELAVISEDRHQLEDQTAADASSHAASIAEYKPSGNSPEENSTVEFPSLEVDQLTKVMPALELASESGKGLSNKAAWAKIISQCSQGVIAKGIQYGIRSGDPSAFAGASILASLCNPTKDEATQSSLASNDDNHRLETPTLPSVSGSIPGAISDFHLMKGCTKHNVPTVTDGDKATTAVHVDLDTSNGVDGDSDEELAKSSTTNVDLRPLIHMVDGPPLEWYDNVLKQIEDRKEFLMGLESLATNPTSSRSQTFKDGLKRGILAAREIEVSFVNFPYYLSENTKNALLSCAYMHLKCKNFVKYAADILSLNPRMLLSGPTGSEIYQETLAKALAKHFDVRLLIIDCLMLPGVSFSKDSISLKESGRTEKSSGFTKQRSAIADAVQLRRPASSVEADIVGTSSLNCQSLPKQDSSTATSKNYIFKEGDRVKFVGSTHSSGLPFPAQRGPNYGFRGKVVLAFEEKGSFKIGVRFDKQIVEGNDLGGLCEQDHGFFCTADLLRLDCSVGDDSEKLAINELIEVVIEESKTGPLIVFLKDAEKSLAVGADSYLSLKNRLESLPAGVLLIGSHTQMDNRKDKSHPGGLLFTKFGSSQTALLDFAFPDSISKLHERSKEIPKTLKQMTKLFPNKISIQLPEDEGQLLDWKQQLDLDVENLKAKANNASIRSFLNRNGLECSDLERICIKDQTLTNEILKSQWA